MRVKVKVSFFFVVSRNKYFSRNNSTTQLFQIGEMNHTVHFIKSVYFFFYYDNKSRVEKDNEWTFQAI